VSLKSSRRRFLQRSLQGIAITGISEVLTNTFFNSLVSKAFAQGVSNAQVGPNPGGYYFNLHMFGAPPRWAFDLPLTPNGKTAQNFVPGNFGTGFTKTNNQIQLTYNPVQKTIGGKTLWLPPVWNYHTSRNFDQVLANTLFIRGMDMELNSHNLGTSRNVSPNVGGLSIQGAVADKSNRALASIVDNRCATSTAFKSSKGFVPSSANTGNATANIAALLLRAFKPIPNSRMHHKDQSLALQDQVFSQLESEMANMGFSKSAIESSYENATQLIDENIQSLGERYPAVKAKYESLITEAFTPAAGSLPGLNSTSIPVSATDPRFNVGSGITASAIGHSDLRNLSNSSISALGVAQSFALMEIFTNKLSTNFTMTMGHPIGVPISASRSVPIAHDQHFTGSIFSTYITTLYYRSLLSCLSEFVGHLKSLGIFDQSIIHVTGDFNRNPRQDGSGADHGIEGSNATIISGKINSPMVIGNLSKNSRGLGTWGGSASLNFGPEQRPIKVNDVARTITSMLGVQDVVSNGFPLMKYQGGIWVPQYEEAENV
tara:strand:+ start:3029 stop:4663 length:1635 start_codon:yes stop_codon:yes gene_type:complete